MRSCVTPKPDTGAAGSRNARSCRWAKRASAASVSTNGSAAQRQKPDPASRVAPQVGAMISQTPERVVAPEGLGGRTEETTMTTKLVAMVLLTAPLMLGAV